MFEVIRTQWKFWDDKIDKIIFQFQFFEHFCQFFSGDCLLSIFDVLKG